MSLALRTAVRRAVSHSRPAVSACCASVQVRAYHGDQVPQVGNYHKYYGDMPKHRSNAETLIADVPPIEVDGNMAVCEGGGGENGHPAEWIQLDTRDGRLPAVCKYCGLRYIKKAGDDKAKAATKAALVANTFP